MSGIIDPTLPTENLARLEQLKFSTDTDNDVVVRTKSKSDSVSLGYISGLLTLVTINPTTWTAIPPVVLVDRQSVSIQNKTGETIWMNWVGADLDATIKGWEINNDYERSWPVQDGAVIYLKSSSNTVKVVVEELKK